MDVVEDLVVLEVVPVAGIDRDPGNGARLKLVKTTLTHV